MDRRARCRRRHLHAPAQCLFRINEPAFEIIGPAQHGEGVDRFGACLGGLREMSGRPCRLAVIHIVVAQRQLYFGIVRRLLERPPEKAETLIVLAKALVEHTDQFLVRELVGNVGGDRIQTIDGHADLALLVEGNSFFDSA